jgi:hypothetical protein
MTSSLRIIVASLFALATITTGAVVADHQVHTTPAHVTASNSPCCE